MPVPAFAVGPARALPRRWRRTRLGLALSGIGLLLTWVPFVAAISVLFLSLGSTFLFLGARAAGRKHEVRVSLAFLFLAAGGVIVGVLTAAFLLQAYDAARARQPLSSLRDIAGLLNWGTLPATFLLAGGFGLQAVTLLPRRGARILLTLCALLAATAAVATWLAGPEVATLGNAPVRTGAVVDYLFRLSLFRLVEAPAYVGLAIAYFLAYWDSVPLAESRSAMQVPAGPEQG